MSEIPNNRVEASDSKKPKQKLRLKKPKAQDKEIIKTKDGDKKRVRRLKKTSDKCTTNTGSKIETSDKRYNTQRKPSQLKGPLRTEELTRLEYKLVNNKEFKLINSTNRSRVYRVQINKDIYKLTVPLAESNKISLGRYNFDSEPDEVLSNDTEMSFVIKNFNSKLAQKFDEKRGILFFVNYLINNYDALKLDPHHYKLYEINKLL